MAAPDDLEEIELRPLGEGDIEVDPNGESPVLGRPTTELLETIVKHPEQILRPPESRMKKNWHRSFIPPEPILTAIKVPSSRRECKYFLFTRFPIIGWLWIYQLKFLLGDIISGITIAVMHIPQGLAYGLLSGLPAVYGLYGSFVPVIVYSFLGTSRHISVGTFAVVSLMVANGITHVLESNEEMYPCLNGTENNDIIVSISGTEMSCEELKVKIAVTLSFLSGIFMIILGLFKFGFITILLSESLISGYTTGAAAHVFTSQAKHIFGLDIEPIRTLFSIPKIWVEVFKSLPTTNIATLLISIVTIITLIIFRIVDRKVIRKLKIQCWSYSSQRKGCFKNKDKFKWPVPLPSQLIVVVVGAIISYAASFSHKFDVNIIEEVPLGLPSPSLPTVSYMIPLIQDAAVISIVTFSVSISLAQVFAKQHNYTVSPDQEFIAYGAMNLVGSFFSCLNTAGSLSRSTVQSVSGGKTQLVGLISSSIMLLVLVALGHLFEPLPNAVLASIIWVALYGMFSQIVDVWRYFKLSMSDMFIWLVVFTATVLLGVDLGLGIGVGFSLAVILFKIVLPKSLELDPKSYDDIANKELITRLPDVIIYRFQAPLCFINCKVFQARLDIVCGIDRRASSDDKPGCIQALFYKILKKKRGNWSPHSPTHPVNKVHTLILDCSSIGFMDAMGVKTMQQLVLDFDKFGIQVLFAALTSNNYAMLERVGFFDKCGKEWIFRTLDDATRHATAGAKLRPGHKEEALYTVTNLEDSEEQAKA
ncbi:PREDICTED: solute carrier family 26 member 6-like [Amphimedon queenslandica]|uniref:STAS domain-containing protein n=2 Tax=Amphimedon queenslandica TaxID=400682 RepID=A0AAN0K4D2_AMPQE|nr:PREDICTED: solute carrier family 26 member 6-like [Amphimedon queenslandica]|eukprot:XP_019864177.1 PREDICTED: solute carrier family 26 member 6-like [Amphimedon queenslandica]